jgi:toxin ParE1/3/4
VTLRLVVRPEVDTDLHEAETWYITNKSLDLVRNFSVPFLKPIDRVFQNPFLYRVRQSRRQVRWAYTRRFPYRVVFKVKDDTVVVYAVLHGARHDRHWKERVDS